MLTNLARTRNGIDWHDRKFVDNEPRKETPILERQTKKR